MRKLVSIVFFSSFCFICTAETGSEFLQKVRSNYEDLNSLNLTMYYELYKGHESEEITEAYEAFYGRIGKESYRKINSTELVNSKEYSLQINHTEKVIVVSEPSSNELFDSDVETSLSFCQDVLVSMQDDVRIITLVLRPKTDLPYSRIVVSVDKKYRIHQMIFYYAAEVNFSGSYSKTDFAQPKLIVKYDELSEKWKDPQGLMNLDRYILIENNKISPSNLYSGYTILNLTNTLTHE